MKFFSSLWRSVYDPTLYRQVGSSYNFGDAIWRYMRLAMLVFGVIALVAMVPLAIAFGPGKVQQLWGKVRTAILAAYPAGLVLDISQASGVVTNATGPVIIPMTVFDNAKMSNGDVDAQYTNFLVIDTEATPDMVENYKTAILVTNTVMVIRNSQQGAIRMIPLTSSMETGQELHITSGVVETMITKAEAFLVANKSAIMIGAVIGGVVGGLVMLALVGLVIGFVAAIMIAVYALVVWLVARMIWVKQTYAHAYSRSIIGYVLPCILGWIPGLEITRWMQVVILCVIVGRMYYISREDKTLMKTQVVDASAPVDTMKDSHDMPM